MDIREPKQNEIIKNYLDKNPDKSTLVLSTGLGKSKIVIEIIRKKMPSHTLILVPNTTLKEFSWKTEFYKFNLKDYFDKYVTVETYQTAYKWKKDIKNLDNSFIIADEVDFAADVPEYSKVFYEYSHIQQLGITGFITDAKKDWFNTHLPIFAEYKSENAQNDGLLNKTHFVFVKYGLSRAKTTKITYKNKLGEFASFYQSENDTYEYQNRKFKALLGEQTKLENEFKLESITFLEYNKRKKTNDYNHG